MRKRTVPFNLDEYGDPIEGGKNFNPEMDEYAELELADGGRIGDLEQEMMDLEYEQEMAHFNRVKDEPGLQEVSLFAPKAPFRNPIPSSKYRSIKTSLHGSATNNGSLCRFTVTYGSRFGERF